jgi:hypothetical protein
VQLTTCVAMSRPDPGGQVGRAALHVFGTIHDMCFNAVISVASSSVLLCLQGANSRVAAIGGIVAQTCDTYANLRVRSRIRRFWDEIRATTGLPGYGNLHTYASAGYPNVAHVSGNRGRWLQ